MRTGAFVGLVLTLALVCKVGVVGGDPPREGKPDRVTRLINELIQELGHEEFPKREAASKELLVLGPAALAALRRAAASHTDLEVKKRAAAAIKRIVAAQEKGKIKFDRALVDETEWLVAGFERGRLGVPHPVPWVFHADGTVQAGDLWSGTWQTVGENSVRVISNTDDCRVVFLSRRRFVAFKGDALYRQGSAR